MIIFSISIDNGKHFILPFSERVIQVDDLSLAINVDVEFSSKRWSFQKFRQHQLMAYIGHHAIRWKELQKRNTFKIEVLKKYKIKTAFTAHSAKPKIKSEKEGVYETPNCAETNIAQTNWYINGRKRNLKRSSRRKTNIYSGAKCENNSSYHRCR